jgi:regulator of nucleoside diphosphate kinase
MERKMVITINDYQRLLGLIEFASLTGKMPDIISTLYRGLVNAKMLPQTNISSDVVTMNSRILLKDILNEREADVTITYPQDADNRERKISVFSSIGVALLGRRVGDIVSWTTPKGVGEFEILEVIYQPEAVGDYSL